MCCAAAGLTTAAAAGEPAGATRAKAARSDTLGGSTTPKTAGAETAGGCARTGALGAGGAAAIVPGAVACGRDGLGPARWRGRWWRLPHQLAPFALIGCRAGARGLTAGSTSGMMRCATAGEDLGLLDPIFAIDAAAFDRHRLRDPFQVGALATG